MTSNEFFRGLLAAVAVQDQKRLYGSHSAIHRAFFEVLQEVKKPETRKELAIEDLIEIDYDPLYGQSAWFDRALARAQRDHIISFPNPSYDTIEIKYAAEDGRKVLEALGQHVAMKRLAEIFVGQLEAQQARPAA